jgi:putative oxidoreductase
MHVRGLLTIERFREWGPVPVRLIVGYGFLAHGLAKLQKGPEKFVAIVDAIGVPLPWFMAWLTIGVELFCGIALLAGAFVTLAAIPMAAVLLVAMFTVHIQYGFTSIKLMAVTSAGPEFGPPGIETNLLYLACLAMLVLTGPGPCAVDNRIGSKLARRPRRARRARRDDFGSAGMRK